MKWVRGVGSISALAVVASLLLARVHLLGDAGLYAARTTQAPIADHGSIPLDARAILIAKCADCHSAQTHAQFYGHFAPMSWLMERDIVEARKAMNLSRWDSYSADQQQTLKAKIMQETKSQEMPLPQYRMIHWDSRITPADIQVFTRWNHDASAPATDAVAQASGEGDPVRGAALFEKRCVGCHSLTENHRGPRLQGVYGRTTGSVPGFAYSDALKKANIVWNAQSLEKWLTDPDAFLPGNNMDFLLPKAQERKDLISFLEGSGSALAHR
jgi:cytochrome c